jgi:hypothetical protein
MIIKFNSASPPEYVEQGFLLDDKVTQQQIIGHWITCTDGYILIENGDYIIENTFGLPQLVKASVYNANTVIKQFINETIGKQLVKDLFQTLQGQNLTNTEEADIISRVQITLTCLLTGFIRGARIVCNNTATGGSFTAARKTYMLGQIDAALLKL